MLVNCGPRTSHAAPGRVGVDHIFKMLQPVAGMTAGPPPPIEESSASTNSPSSIFQAFVARHSRLLLGRPEIGEDQPLVLPRWKSTPRAIVSNSPASPRAACSRTRCGSPGTRAGALRLIFAYLGPAEKKPAVPRYECLEKMDDGEFVERTIPRSAAAARPSFPATGCSILKMWSTPTTSRCCMARSRAAIHQHDGLDAGGEVRDLGAPRLTVRSIRIRETQGFLPGDGSSLPTLRCSAQSRVAQFARVESIAGTLPIDAHVVPHLRSGPGMKNSTTSDDALQIQRKFWCT